MTALAAIALGIWIYLLLGHGKFWQAGPSLLPSRPRAVPSVTVIVPARNEADIIGASLRSLLAQDYQGDFRVLLVDDSSTDGTGNVARAIEDAKLFVLEAAPRPAGWSGKLWALEQGLAAADTDWVLFTDADIEHAPSHLATLVAKAEAGAYDLVSEMVALNCASQAEQALVPAFVFFFAMLYPFALANDSESRVAAAAGGVMLIRRSALLRAGGLEAIKGALIDDVTLAGRLKQNGRIWLGHSQLAMSRRPYPEAADIWRMVARTAYVQLRFSPWLLAGTVLGMLLVYAVPPLALALGPAKARIAGGLGWAAMSAAFLPTLRRFRLSPLRAPLLPWVALFYTAATIGSAVNHYRGRGVVWKQRAYS